MKARTMKPLVPGGALALLASLACSGPTPAPPPPCDAACQDGVALRALRETMKLGFNLTVQGKPAGPQAHALPCIRGGSARIVGTATSNAVQGATEVDLTYVFERCGYVERDEEARESYDMTFTGTITQKGTLAVQPTATTAIVLRSEAMTFEGAIYDPPIPYAAASCVVDVAQNGDQLGGTLCGRTAGFRF